MSEKQECILLLPAAGQGLRMGGDKKKPYMLLAGKPVIVHTLQACLRAAAFSRLIVLVTPGEENLFEEEICKTYFNGNKSITSVPGGITRQDSVFQGLKALQGNVGGEAIICIHDAVRPLVSPLLLCRVIAEAQLCGAAIAAVPLTDTVKLVDEANNVLATPPREHLAAAQTPQCFKYSLLWQAHCRAATTPASDDAALVERLGVTVRIVPGSYENIKLTMPHDLKLAEQYLAHREKEGV
ncbi:MAG: 2-C-methyl-D-erythritol 4-phosphate cytidylyltransferase [Bacillota bacterium]